MKCEGKPLAIPLGSQRVSGLRMKVADQRPVLRIQRQGEEKLVLHGIVEAVDGTL